MTLNAKIGVLWRRILRANCAKFTTDRSRQAAYEIFSIEHRFQRSKSRPFRFKETCARGHQRVVSSKSPYFTVVGKSTVKTVADSHGYASYHNSFGVSGVAFSWIRSYLDGRTQSVRMGSYSSAVTSCSVGVPQGSVLRPLLFSAYTSPLSTIAKSHQVFQQQYADDMQLYVALSPINYSNELITLQSCLSSLHVWFCENGMALNPSKSDAILFGPLSV